MRILPVILALALAEGQSGEANAKPSPSCTAHEIAVVVNVATRTLNLCEHGKTQQEFAVALGIGGIGKRQQGDHRTPLGVYPLGAPRASSQYGTFIPVGYPTPQQIAMGFTGTAVGIHGPPRANVNDGAANTSTDWTWGCIAVASDPEIRTIAAWLGAHPRALLHILPQ
jgi:murein L,D-transpeptidase YafK